MLEIESIKIENIDHLGIIAGIVDEIELVEIIDEKLGTDPREKIPPGLVVKALILNALGMVAKPLYLFTNFFEDKAIEKLLGPEIKSGYLNDDKLGRVMDEIYKLGLTELFIEIVLKKEEKELSEAELLESYKAQSACERGFKFLKNPSFFADSFFGEKPSRLETILWLMSISLLVYNLGQRELRNNLVRAKKGIKNQLGKLTDKPTLRWVFQCFMGIRCLMIFRNGRRGNSSSESKGIIDRFALRGSI